ncbi:hypothetical protein [Aquabacterium sp. NJ1]|uniref:hypothetical protein n=1 Tax=Aquabacterium sp. NJ1 TaxID=1538295 RepID=UPI001269C353|nr:hypothetical protein [Aquabacterium sp. NJ1]
MLATVCKSEKAEKGARLRVGGAACEQGPVQIIIAHQAHIHGRGGEQHPDQGGKPYIPAARYQLFQHDPIPWKII